MTGESNRGAVSAYRAVICRLEDQVDGSDGQLTELVDRAAGGDQDAWNQITERFGNLVWAIARSYRLSTADAADVVQTTWLRLVEQLGRIRDPERLAGWLATTARHESLSVLRRSGRERGWRSVEEIHERVDAHTEPVDLQLLEDERDVQLWRSFEQLPDHCQTLLRVLMATDPSSYAEVAGALDMPVGSIGPTRRRCLEKLRVILANSAYPFDANESRLP